MRLIHGFIGVSVACAACLNQCGCGWNRHTTAKSSSVPQSTVYGPQAAPAVTTAPIGVPYVPPPGPPPNQDEMVEVRDEVRYDPNDPMAPKLTVPKQQR